MRRYRMSKRHSRRSFSRGRRMHGRHKARMRISRGGYRL